MDRFLVYLDSDLTCSFLGGGAVSLGGGGVSPGGGAVSPEGGVSGGLLLWWLTGLVFFLSPPPKTVGGKRKVSLAADVFLHSGNSIHAYGAPATCQALLCR